MILNRIKYFLTPFDGRFEEMNKNNWLQIAWRDTSAGLIVAMMAIPMAMGFAIASGLRPEHGIVAGAVAGLVGALFGGSKYNVYGPVAALIPVIAGIMAAHATPENPMAGHGFLVLICMCSAPILMLLATFGWGKIGNLVPHSIVVGFSIGIAVTIAVTQMGEVLGLKTAVSGGILTKFRIIYDNISQFNGAALLIAGMTFVMTRYMLKISIYLPAPLVALGVGTVLSSTLFLASDLTLIKTKYGAIPTDFLKITAPTLPSWSIAGLGELAFYALAFAFVCGFESLLAARMADRLADNRKTPYNPDKEFWGQGMVQLLVPLLNGMPLSGALARTATNIKVGAMTPLAGIMKCVWKLSLVFFLAKYLELVPMAAMGGILVWVAFNMVKPAEIKLIWNINRFHAGLMIYTATMVILTDFLVGVLSAMVIYGVLYRFFDKAEESPLEAAEPIRTLDQGHTA